MKNKLYLIAFVVLLLTSGGIALFVKKQLDKKRKAKAVELEEVEDLEVTIEELTTEEPTSPKIRELEKPRQALNIESDIHIEHVNTDGGMRRSVAYGMHYNGIAISGVFKDGDEDVLITKSFGSFQIKQGAPTANVSTKGGAAKGKTRDALIEIIMRPETLVSTKGGAVTGKTGAALIKINDTVVDSKTGTPIAQITNSNFVYLMIKNTKGHILREVKVNLLTGAIIGSVQPTIWDGN
ncbi:MAG: hypothetical protein JKY03_13920 [Aureispira sp.]|nr:hypothetical protein [Aureispira sp.]